MKALFSIVCVLALAAAAWGDATEEAYQKLRLGATREDVIASLGKPEQEETFPRDRCGLYYKKLGLRVFVGSDGKVYACNINAPTWELKSGIGIGDSIQDVVRVFGAPGGEFSSTQNFVDRPATLIRNPENGMQSIWYVNGYFFWADPAGKLIQIRVSTEHMASLEPFGGKLTRARQALTGPQKDTAQAKKLLTEIVQENKTIPPGTLCYIYVYLGYIADLEKNRAEAVSWYKKALDIRNADGVRDVAKFGLEQPVTWIRHLDQGTSPTGQSGRKEQLSKGEVTWYKYPFPRLMPSKDLSKEQIAANFEVLVEAIDRTYACFEIKGINWPDVAENYRKRLEKVERAEDFYPLMAEMVNELQDSLSMVANYRPMFAGWAPDLSVDLFDGKAYVTAVPPRSEAEAQGVQVGSEVLEVDDMSVKDRVQAMRPLLPACSSEQAFQRMAYRRLLTGEEGTTVAVKLMPPGALPIEVILHRTTGVKNPVIRKYPFEVTRQRFVHYGRHPSGFGYIHIESFRGQYEIADEFDRALEALRDTPGLILDVRDNDGNMGHSKERILGRFLRERVLAGIYCLKSGPRHEDVQKTEMYRTPYGPWQYEKPVVMLINDVTAGPADTLAAFLKSAGRVTTVGSATHGAFTNDGVYAALPCNLVVRISNGYLCDAKGAPLEGRGVAPDVTVTPTIADVLAGRDPVLEKAVEILKQQAGAMK